jgi:hypothetical protein
MDGKITRVGPEPSDGIGFRKPGRVGIEALMLMAKYDDEFRAMLLSDRKSALDQCGIDLSPAERMVAEKISREALSRHIERFEMPGVTGKSLPNWRAAASVMLLVSTILFGTVDCSNLPGRAGSSQEAWFTGWVDGDTYHQVAVGVPSKNITDPDGRMKSAQRAAVLNAQYQAIEYFKGEEIVGATGIMSDGNYDWKERLFKQLGPIVKAGKAVRGEYDERRGIYRVQLEVREKGLKKMVRPLE